MKFTALLLSAVILSTASAYSNTALDSIYATEEYSFSYIKYIIKDNTIEVTGCSSETTSMQIPNTINGMPVTSISANAVIGNTVLEEIVIPENVKTVGEKAFSGCTSLRVVTIGAGLESIGESAFTKCPSLEKIMVDSNNKTFRSSNNSLCSDNKLIVYAGDENAVIENSITSIGKRAFSGKTNLVSISIPESVTEIGEYAFSGCISLLSVEIPDSVKSLGSSCFFSCPQLEKVKLSSSLTVIPDNCFYSCQNLKIINIPDSVIETDEGAFLCCESLTSLYVPSSVTKIGNNAFGMTYNIRTNQNEVIANFILKSESDSNALKYAVSENITFTVNGDINTDGIVDATDASGILTDYSETSVGKESELSEIQKISADYNNDGIIDATDASAVLTFYAESSVS